MFISTKEFIKVFKNYTIALRQEIGRPVSAREKRILESKIEKIANEYTIKGRLKKAWKNRNLDKEKKI